MTHVIKIDLKQLIYRAYKNKSFVLIIIFPILSLFISLNKDRIYVSNTILIQQSIFQASKSSGLLGGNLSNIAKFAGIGVNNSTQEQISHFEILQSKVFLLGFIKKYKLETTMFAKSWNGKEKTWRKLSTLSRFRHNIIKYFNEGYVIPENRQPTDYMIYERFMQRYFKISRHEKTGVIILSLYWETPEKAAYLCNLLVKDLNEYLRAKDLEYIALNLKIIKKKYKEVAIDTLRLQLSTMIAEQMQRQTIAEAKSDYAFKIIDTAIPNYQQSSPNYLGAILSAIVFATILILMINFIAIEKSKKKNEI